MCYCKLVSLESPEALHGFSLLAALVDRAWEGKIVPVLAVACAWLFKVFCLERESDSALPL